MTYVSPDRIAPGGLRAPFDGGRPAGSALQFMVTPEAPVHLHRIANDQLYLFQLGDPLDVLLLRPDGSHDRVVVGPDLAAGHVLVLPLPGGTFHTARLVEGGAWFLGSSTEWPRRAARLSAPSAPAWPGLGQGTRPRSRAQARFLRAEATWAPWTMWPSPSLGSP
jgi:hypothetical protein